MLNYKNFLNENKVMTIIDLSKMIVRMGLDEDAILLMLQEAYKKTGDEGVVKTFKDITGVKIEALRKGVYVFKY